MSRDEKRFDHAEIATLFCRQCEGQPTKVCFKHRRHIQIITKHELERIMKDQKVEFKFIQPRLIQLQNK